MYIYVGVCVCVCVCVCVRVFRCGYNPFVHPRNPKPHRTGVTKLPQTRPTHTLRPSPRQPQHIQDWFTRNQIGPALQTHLQSYSDMDGPRRLIEVCVGS